MQQLIIKKGLWSCKTLNTKTHNKYVTHTYPTRYTIAKEKKIKIAR